MKIFILLTALLVIFGMAQASQFSKLLKSVSGKCKKQENASDDDIEKISNGETPATKEGKCLTACLGEQFGIIKDNKISKASLGKMTKMMGNDDDKKKKVEEMMNVCAEVTNADRCEAAGEIWQCINRELASRNLKSF